MLLIRPDLPSYIGGRKDICFRLHFRFVTCDLSLSLVSFIVRCIDSSIDSIGTSVKKNQKRVPYPKRDIVKSPNSFGFHNKLEAVGKSFLAESHIIEFNATFFPQF